MSANMNSELQRKIDEFARGVKFWQFLRVATMGTLAISLIVAAAFAFDRLFDVDGVYRLPFLVLAAIAVLIYAGRALLVVVRPLDFDRIANQLDLASGDKHDHLRSLLNFAERGDEKGFFIEMTEKNALEKWKTLNPAAYLDSGTEKKLLGGVALLAALCFGLTQVEASRLGLHWQRFIDPFGNHMRPTSTWFEIEEKDEVLRSGDTYVRRMVLKGLPVTDPIPMVQIRYRDGSSISRTLKARSDGSYHFTSKNLNRDFNWVVQMNEARSKHYDVPVLPRPTMIEAKVQYVYPKYSKLGKKNEVLSGRTITALEGTRIKLNLKTNVPLKKASGRTEDNSYSFRFRNKKFDQPFTHFIMGKSGKLYLDLISNKGIPSKHELPFTLKVVKDAAPAISIKNKLDGKSFYLSDMMEIQYEASDDLGLSEIVIKSVPVGVRNVGPVHIDVDLEKYGSKKAKGKVKVQVSELLSKKANGIQLNLITRDTKGQESSTQKVKIKIAAESYEEQLRSMHFTYHGHPSTPHDDRGISSKKWHEDNVKNLKRLDGRLKMISDELKGQDKPINTKSHEGGLLGRRGLFNDLRTRWVYGLYWNHDIQNANQYPRIAKIAERAGIWSQAFSYKHLDRKELRDLLHNPKPAKALKAYAEKVKSWIPMAEKVKASHAIDYRTVAAELSGILCREIANRRDGLDPKNPDQGQLQTIENLLGDLAKNFEKAIDKNDKDLAKIKKLASSEKLAKDLETQRKWFAGLRKRLRDMCANAAVAFRSHENLGYLDYGKRELDILRQAIYQQADNAIADELEMLWLCVQFIKVYASIPKITFPGLVQSAEGKARIGAFRFHRALEGTMMAAQSFRLKVMNDELSPGHPEFENLWLGVRESLFLLRSLAHHGEITKSDAKAVEALSSKAKIFEAWQPDAKTSSLQMAEALLILEGACSALSQKQLSPTKALLADVVKGLKDYPKHIVTCLQKLDAELTEEIAFTREKKAQMKYELARIQRLKLNIKIMHTAILKSYDFAEMAKLYGAAPNADLSILPVLYVNLGKYMDEFERTVEHIANEMRFDGRSDKFGQAWKSRVQEIEKFQKRTKEMIAFWKGVAQGKQKADSPSMPYRKLIAHALGKERKAATWIMDREKALANSKTLFESIANNPKDAPALWIHGVYELHHLQQKMNSPKKDKAAWIAQAKRAKGLLNPIEELPSEIRESLDILEDLIQAKDDSTFGQLSQDLASAFGGLKDLVREEAVHSSGHFETYLESNTTQNVSALLRARKRAKQRMQDSHLQVQRVSTSLAMKHKTRGMSSFYFASIESELARRKASLTQSQSAMGGIALKGVGALKIPKHLYYELKRAREKSMPELFKKRSFDYLSRIMEQAR